MALLDKTHDVLLLSISFPLPAILVARLSTEEPMKLTAQILFALVAILLLNNGAQAEQPKVPKGIIFVLIDDIGYGDINVLTPGELATPNLDSLYQESITLTDFHVGTTCAPTRASLMTGRSVNAGGVWHTIAGRELLREDEQTMAEVFQANGWATGIFGKWHLGDGYPFSPRFRGFETAVVHGGGGIGQGPDFWDNDYYSDVDFAGNKTKPDTYFANGELVTADKFCTDFWFDRSMEFIKKSSDADKPFFCYLPTNAAHGPFNAPHGKTKGFDGLIENIDDNMARLDKFLDAEGLKEDVLLIFTCDNGTAGKRLGGLRGKKGSHYDGGHNVPCFLRWKNGGMAGSVDTRRDVNSLTAVMDFLPTFIDMCGLEKPEGGNPLQGISLKERLTQPDFKPTSRTLIVDTQRAASLVKWKKACIMQDQVVDGVIKSKWRLIRTGPQKKPELYDFLSDRDTNEDLGTGHPMERELTAAYEKWFTKMSNGSEPYPPFVVNHEKEPDLSLYSHSWIGEDASPWHQNSVRKAGKGSRVHSIRFDHPGQYNIQLRRWPREDGGPIAGKCEVGECVVISPAKAKLHIAGVGNFYSGIEEGASAVNFNLSVKVTTPTTIETAFLDSEGNVICGAYCTYIKAVK